MRDTTAKRDTRRNHLRKLIGLAIPLLLGGLIWWSGWWPTLAARDTSDSLQGYVEGEFLYLAAPAGGFLSQLQVARGQTVAAGQALFALDPQPEDLVLAEAEQRLQAARAKLEDLRRGQRPSELAAVAAQVVAAQADVEFTRKELKRYQDLLRNNFAQREAVDTAETAVARNQARLEQLQAQLQTAKLGGREFALQAAEAEAEAAAQTVAKARWTLRQKQQTAPAAGQVSDVLHYPGEWVNASQPVVALLPPERVKIRFAIPEARLSSLRLGQAVHFSCDGCRADLTAQISHISPQPEYTPPVLYNRDSRARLVFLAEAVPPPAIAATLHPGQPVEARLSQPAEP
jgi:HlyD family secretion protein